MNKLTHTALAAGLAFGALTACGEKGSEQEAQVTALAYGIDANIIGDGWVHYEDKENTPDGTIQNLRSEQKFDGCKEVDDSYFGWNLDDSECWGRISLREDTHWKARYKTVYDYDRLEKIIVRQCIAPTKPENYKPAEVPAIDEECIATAKPDQQVQKTARYVVWVETKNPKYDPEKPSKETPTITKSQNVTEADWNKIDIHSPVTIKVSGNHITKIIFPK